MVSTARLIVPLTDSEAPHLILQGRAFRAEAFDGNIINFALMQSLCLVVL